MLKTNSYFAATLLLLATACGGDDGDGGGGGADAGPGGDDAAAGCMAGQQDEDGDGVCHPDCASIECENGTCAIDGDGMAVCTCDAGFEGDACDALAQPAATEAAFWIDASDASTLALRGDDESLETWTDRSPSALVGTTADMASSATLVEDAQNGLPVVHFDGEDDNVTFADFEAVTNESGYTYFMVLRTVEPEGSPSVFQAEGDAGDFADEIKLSVASGGIQADHFSMGEGGGFVSNLGAYGDASWGHGEFRLLTVRRSNQTMAMWLDGNAMVEYENEVPATLDEVLDLVLGGNNELTQHTEFDLGEMIVVADNLIHEDRIVWEQYLSAKWFGSAFEYNMTSYGATSVWLDAANSDTVVENSGAVSSWVNQGMWGGAFSSSFPDGRPTVSEGSLGGKDVIHFDGSDALGSNEVPLYGEDGVYTIFVVLVPPTEGSSHRIFRAGQDENPGLQLDILPSVPSLSWLHRWAPGAVVQEDDETFLPAVDTSAAQLIKIERNASGNYHVVIGENSHMFTGDEANNIPAFSEDLDWVLGGDTTAAPGDDALEGDIAELVMFVDALGNSEETAATEHLKAKWGL